jgi:tetratricopeptide (TPR) repeat protein
MDSKIDEKKFHKKIAVNLFNYVWDLLDKGDSRTENENYDMVHSAHTSLYHWSQVGDATNLNVGEWQISRVYSTLKNHQSALFHAEKSRQIAIDNELPAFYQAYALESLSRAYSLAKNKEACEKYMKMARDKLNDIEKKDERKMIEDDLDNIEMPS